MEMIFRFKTYSRILRGKLPHACANREIGILVRFSLNTAGTRAFDPLKYITALGPFLGSKAFNVRNVNRDSSFAPNTDCLSNRTHQTDRVWAFIAHMTVVD